MLLAVSTADQLIAASTFGAGLAVSVLVNRLMAAAGRRRPAQEATMRLLGRILVTIIVAVAGFTALSQLGLEIAPLLGALGIGGVVVAISLQPVLGNLVGLMLIHARRPIRLGDQIDSNGHVGTVLDINGRAVVILTHDGTTVYIPNLKLLEEPLENLTREPVRRTRLQVEVDYRTDLRHAQQVLSRTVAAVDGVDSLPVAVIVRSFEASGVLMEIRFWHPSEELEAVWVVSEVAIAAREALRAEGIEIAFPQRVIHRAAPPSTPTPSHDPSTGRERSE